MLHTTTTVQPANDTRIKRTVRFHDGKTWHRIAEIDEASVTTVCGKFRAIARKAFPVRLSVHEAYNCKQCAKASQ